MEPKIFLIFPLGETENGRVIRRKFVVAQLTAVRH